MKRKVKKTIAALLIFLLPALYCLADPPGPPDPGGNPFGGGGVPVGGPIDDGTLMLIGMGMGYIAVKYLKKLKTHNEEKESVE